MTKHTTIIEQITGYHDDGTPYVQIVTVSVDPVYCDDEDEQEEADDWCETLLMARVALASAAPRHRAAAEAWLDEQDVDAADEAEWIERALTEGCTRAAIQAIEQALSREAEALEPGQALCWHDDAGTDARTWDGRVRLRDDEYVVRRLADGSLDWGRQRGGYGTAWYDGERAAVDIWSWWLEGLGDRLAAEDALSGRLEDVQTGLSVVTADEDATGWVADVGNCAVEYPHAESAAEAAQEYVDDGSWGDASDATVWITVYVWPASGDRDDAERHKIALDPDAPPCVDDGEHVWQDVSEQLHGAGMRYAEACVRCGCGKHTDTWAQDPEDGQQGLTSIRYERGEYPERVEAAEDEDEDEDAQRALYEADDADLRARVDAATEQLRAHRKRIAQEQSPRLREEAMALREERDRVKRARRTARAELIERLPDTLRARHSEGYANGDPITTWVDSALRALVLEDHGLSAVPVPTHERLSDKQYQRLCALREQYPDAEVTPVVASEYREATEDDDPEDVDSDGEVLAEWVCALVTVTVAGDWRVRTVLPLDD